MNPVGIIKKLLSTVFDVLQNEVKLKPTIFTHLTYSNGQKAPVV